MKRPVSLRQKRLFISNSGSRYSGGTRVVPEDGRGYRKFIQGGWGMNGEVKRSCRGLQGSMQSLLPLGVV